MPNDVKLFVESRSLNQQMERTLEIGYAVEATGKGTIVLEIASATGKTSRSELHEVLRVPVQFA